MEEEKKEEIVIEEAPATLEVKVEETIDHEDGMK